MHKFLKNPLETLANAAEINLLKDRREKLRNEKHEVDMKISRYAEQIELAKSCETLGSAHKECLIHLRSIFAKNNIQYQLTREEYEAKYTDPQLLQYKTLYDQLILMETTVNPCISVFTGSIGGNNENAYKQKSDNLEKQIEEINQKLAKVRGKQFG